MMSKPDRILVGGALAIGLALGVGTTAIVSGDGPPEPPTVAQLAKRTHDAAPREKVDDTAHDAALAAARQAGLRVTDFKSENVQPGQAVKVGASFPIGAKLGKVELTGAAHGAFRVDAATCEPRTDATWCEVAATNTSQTARRLTALVEWEMPP
jgi:hypothetical protein